MAEVEQCPECGAEMPAAAPAGLCPRCLLAVGLERPDDRDRPLSGGTDAPTTPHSGSFVPPPPAELAAHFPQLEILDLIGYGGMGAVYKARQRNLDRLVALKIIRPESADTPSFAERFNREARLLARLSHPHIVAVYDFGRVDIALPAADANAQHAGKMQPLFYFLMEYVDGANLRELLREGDLTPPQALSIVPQICEALQFAHDEGIVHRDIKPENILLDKRGRVKIADFGLAKLAVGSTEEYTLTGTHQVMGTPRYMAPEQMEGSRAVDHRADIFSLGVVFYEMLTGEVPAGHFEPPSKKVEIDVRLDEVVLRSLAREPERRYQQASEIKTDVERCQSRPVDTIPPLSSPSDHEAEDFLLINPRLPVAARWITVYAIVIRPLLWVLAMMFVVLGFEASLAGDYAEAVIDHAVDIAGGIFHLVFVVMVVIGGFKLRALRRGAEQWILAGLALGVGLGLLVFILQLTFTPRRIDLLREIARTNPAQLIADDFTQKEIDAILSDKEYPILVPTVIGAGITFSWLVLDIAVFAWLWRNGSRLPLTDKPPSTDRKSDDGELSRPRLSKMAIASVVATFPAIFLLGYLYMVTTQHGIPEFLRLVRAPDFGEVAVAFFFLPGVIGTAFGASALYRIRNSQGRSSGTWLAAAGALFYPLMALDALVAPLIASAIYVGLGFENLSDDQLRGPRSQILIWSILLTLAAIDYFIVRKAWPRLTRHASLPPLCDSTENLQVNSAKPSQGGDPAFAAATTSDAADEPVVLRGTLRRAWDDCWAERDRLLTLFVQTTLGLAFALCLIAFLSFRVDSKHVPDPKNQPIRNFVVVCGQSSSPWFRLETNPAGKLGWEWEIGWTSWSSAIMLVGFVAWGVMWEIEKARKKAAGKLPRWWNGSPVLALFLWALGTIISLVAAFVMASLP